MASVSGRWMEAFIKNGDDNIQAFPAGSPFVRSKSVVLSPQTQHNAEKQE